MAQVTSTTKNAKSQASSRLDPVAVLNAPFEPVRRPLLYAPALIIVAFLMVLLPVVYLALAAGLGYLVYLHAAYNHTLLEIGGGGRAVIFMGVVYIGPILGGGTAILFMLRPFFAPRLARPEPYSLAPHEQKRLYSYVGQLCQRIGAPMPSRIDVDCHANASAGPARGLVSILRGDLALTIGLPLVLGMDLRQLSGVLAHEFGHFTQRAAMGAWYVINSINRWFARVVYERDAWDESLANATADGGHYLIVILVLMVRLCVALTRGVLWVFMMIAHMMSSFLSRQMEYDADRFEVRIAGSEHFEPTSRRVIELDVGFHAATGDLGEAWAKGKLPENLASLIVGASVREAAGIEPMVRKILTQKRAGVFDTHPSMRSRIAHAMRENSPGIISLEAPATILFHDLPDVCKRASYLHYRAVLGERIMDATFVPTETVEGTSRDNRESGAAAGRLWPMTLGEQRTFWPGAPTLEKPENVKETLAMLKAARDRLNVIESRAMVGVYRPVREANDARRGAEIGAGLVRAGIRFPAAKVGLAAATSEAAAEAAMEAERKLDEALAGLSPIEDDVRTRLMSSLSLLYVRELVERVDGGLDARQVAKRSLASLHDLRRHEAAAERLIGTLTTLDAICRIAGQPPTSQTRAEMRRLGEAANTLAVRLRKALEQEPTDAGEIGVEPEEFAPDPANSNAVLAAGGEVIREFYGAHARALGQLAMLCEQVERALRLEPIGELTLPSIVTR